MSTASLPAAPATLAALTRLALGLPAAGDVVRTAVGTVGLRAQLHLDGFTAGEELALAQVLAERQATQDRSATAHAPRTGAPEPKRFKAIR